MSTEAELQALRLEIGAGYGLNERESAFLTGVSFQEIEASAQALAGLVASHGRRDEQQSPTPNVLEVALAEKAERKRRLAALFTGRSVQARDATTGRFVSGGFDGGARRAALPPPRNAEREHVQTLSTLISRSRLGGRGEADLGARF